MANMRWRCPSCGYQRTADGEDTMYCAECGDLMVKEIGTAEENAGVTTITCNRTTKQRLERFGNKSETWDELLTKVADEAGVPKDE